MSNKTPIKFTNKDRTQFFTTLKKRVDVYFAEKGISRHANGVMVFKTITLLAAYLIPFFIILFLQPGYGLSLMLWAVMGFALAGIGMSIMHDANHGAYSSNEKVNYLLGHTLNLLGGSVFNWKMQHNYLHHMFTNIEGVDEDIKAKFGLRFSPHSAQKNIHRFQWIYAFGLYAILTLYWAILKDFLQFKRYIDEGVNKSTRAQNALAFGRMLLSKVVYFAAMLAMPVLIFGLPFYQVATGFVIMHIIAGLVLTITFQLAHTVEGTSHPLPDENGVIENEWAIHQMNTTVNFSRQSKWVSWYVGGLNFQVEHHLFPKICHVHYPHIAPIVKQTAEEFGVPYLENESVWQAFSSHFAMLRQYGMTHTLDEVIG